MSAANDAKSRAGSTSLVVDLLSPVKGKHNGRNNYSEWAPGMQTVMGMHYGAMARVFLDQVLYMIPELGPEDAPQQSDLGMEGLTTENLNSIRVLAIVERAKKVRELRDDQPKLFNSILSKVSVASQLIIEADGEWDAAKAAEDPTSWSR